MCSFLANALSNKDFFIYFFWGGGAEMKPGFQLPTHAFHTCIPVLGTFSRWDLRFPVHFGGKVPTEPRSAEQLGASSFVSP